MKRVAVLVILGFFGIYTLFWTIIISSSKKPSDPFFKSSYPPGEYFYYYNGTAKSVLSSQDTKISSSVAQAVQLPPTVLLLAKPRRQAFNLSCEFASAATIIHYFTKNPEFSPQNEFVAEQTLISQVNISQNPNAGIRMGISATESAEVLYQNLNQRAGGIEFYGIHAPPFFDIFANYGLLASPIDKNSDVVFNIKQAVASGHLVMVWARAGYGKPIDVALSYGSTIQLFRGEHTFVIHGYDEQNFTVMDPGSGRSRGIKYKDLIDATSIFALPFLEVYKGSSDGRLYEVLDVVNRNSGLDRSLLTVLIQNNSKSVGKGNEIAKMLREFGYNVSFVQNKSNYENADISLYIKRGKEDFLRLLQKDLFVLGYEVSEAFYSEVASDSADVVVTIGEEL